MGDQQPLLGPGGHIDAGQGAAQGVADEPGLVDLGPADDQLPEVDHIL